jgi:hypothetical protein
LAVKITNLNPFWKNGKGLFKVFGCLIIFKLIVFPENKKASGFIPKALIL